MNTKSLTVLALSFFVLSMSVLSSASAESINSLPSPHKQMVSGTEANDVVCNYGLTLIAKLTTGNSACVTPSTADKLEDLGWGQILKKSSMMEDERQMMIEKIMNEEDKQIHDPKIIPSDFTTEITNPYFSLPVGKMIIYDSDTQDGVERIEILVTDGIRTVMGVETVVY